MKDWKPFEDECASCGGSDIRVLTDAKEGYAYDGDDVECLECGLKGGICVDDEDENGDCTARVDWNEED